MTELYKMEEYKYIYKRLYTRARTANGTIRAFRKQWGCVPEMALNHIVESHRTYLVIRLRVHISWDTKKDLLS